MESTNLLVRVSELARLLDGPTPPVVLDVRWNLSGPDGREEFYAGHIPTARFVDLDLELAGPPGEGGRHPLPPYQQFAHAMRKAGLDADTRVVVTDGGNSLAAARLWWMLTDAGHPVVRVLDGGFAAWRTAGRPIATGEDGDPAPGGFTGHPGHRRSVDASGVQELLARGGTVVDVRAHERFTGATEPMDPIAGHIPGAVSAPSSDNFIDQGGFRPAEELRQRFDQLGIGSDAAVYCGSGITACQTLLAMQIAGIDDATLFPGSWSAWITDPDRPVATGE